MIILRERRVSWRNPEFLLLQRIGIPNNNDMLQVQGTAKRKESSLVDEHKKIALICFLSIGVAKVLNDKMHFFDLYVKGKPTRLKLAWSLSEFSQKILLTSFPLQFVWKNKIWIMVEKRLKLAYPRLHRTWYKFRKPSFLVIKPSSLSRSPNFAIIYHLHFLVFLVFRYVTYIFQYKLSIVVGH